ncbi:MAG: hypothetical protein IJU20_03880 [Clostridia bacterium]|nr:hypothetical protein [Clostridia bacterium]
MKPENVKRKKKYEPASDGTVRLSAEYVPAASGTGDPVYCRGIGLHADPSDTAAL